MSQVRYRKEELHTLSGRKKAASNTSGETNRFSVFDIFRILFGILVLNFALSYYITGSPLWGNQTKLTNVRYLQFEASRILRGGDYITLTDDELAKYNGVNKSLPIYVAVAGRVYDVSANPLTYGPGGPYSFFSGRDAARAFVTGCFQTDLTHDLRGLDQEKAKADVAGWQRFFDKNHKYWYVGQVVHKPITGDPPPPCDAMGPPRGVRG